MKNLAGIAIDLLPRRKPEGIIRPQQNVDISIGYTTELDGDNLFAPSRFVLSHENSHQEEGMNPDDPVCIDLDQPNLEGFRKFLSSWLCRWESG